MFTNGQATQAGRNAVILWSLVRTKPPFVAFGAGGPSGASLQKRACHVVGAANQDHILGNSTTQHMGVSRLH